jgi:hypothetical protein
MRQWLVPMLLELGQVVFFLAAGAALVFGALHLR